MTDIFDEASALEQMQREQALAAHARRARIYAKSVEDSAAHCQYCEEEIPQGRREALPGVQSCVTCQSAREKER